MVKPKENAPKVKGIREGSFQDYCTPHWAYKKLIKFVGWRGEPILDVAASKENTLTDSFITERENGLVCPWQVFNWCNPPWNAILIWAARGINEWIFPKNQTLFLVPTRPETKWWKLLDRYAATYMITPRLNYERPRGTPTQGISCGSTLFHLGGDPKIRRLLYLRENEPIYYW